MVAYSVGSGEVADISTCSWEGNTLQVLCGLILGISCLSTAAGEPPVRERSGLLALYTFEQPRDHVIRDQSGNGEPLDLRVERPQGVEWQNGRIVIGSSARIRSLLPARKIATAVKNSGELTVEAWLKPLNNFQNGPARIISISADPGHRNFTLGQEQGQYDVRLRTSTTDENGIPSTRTPEGTTRVERSHVVFTRDRSGTARIYLDGKEQLTQQVAGDLSVWADDFHLSLANEMTGDRPWLGELSLVAIYGRALLAAEVNGNFAAGVRSSLDYNALLPLAVPKTVDFATDVRPILQQHCFECHSAGTEEGGLNLSVGQRAFEGGVNGRVLIKGDSANSRLIHMAAALEPDKAMPPSGRRLTAEQVGLLRAWIDQGAVWPISEDLSDRRIEEAREHWAFQPLSETPLPDVRNADWCQTPIDYFVLARLEQAGLQPARRASGAQILRRMAFDIVGIPPTPAEYEDFSSTSDSHLRTNIESLVNRLLESRHYGERWGRHWLDVAHYADSDGMESDRDRPNAYHYRDFVIRALNDDMPIDQFLRWQLAGDEYEPQNVQAIAATGFLTAGPHEVLDNNLLEEERLRSRYNELDDIVSTVGTGMLGLTLGCARCHDHKYDAVTNRDYYRLLSAFHNGDRTEVSIAGGSEKVLAFRDFGPVPQPTWLFKRADFYDRRQPVQLGFVTALTHGRSPEEYWNQARNAHTTGDSSYQRRAMAEWITDVEHGAGALLARVFVNRVWRHHFGEALVRSVGDFGVRAEPPTHPELLEWLANDLVKNGWQLKRLHRQILLSASYQMASAAVDRPAADPENRLLWKMRSRRLEAEILRDSMLAVSGTLQLESYGPAFKPPISAEAMLARNLKDPYPADLTDSPALRRRSVYMFHKRVVPYPLMQAFDRPDAQQSCGRRDQTTVAPQALALLNDPFVRMVSLDFSERVLREVGHEPSQWIDRAYRLAVGRAPTESEYSASLDFVMTQMHERAQRSDSISDEENRRRSLADFGQTLFSLNEFIYVD